LLLLQLQKDQSIDGGVILTWVLLKSTAKV
jgi:hypothetical protein